MFQPYYHSVAETANRYENNNNNNKLTFRTYFFVTNDQLQWCKAATQQLDISAY